MKHFLFLFYICLQIIVHSCSSLQTTQPRTVQNTATSAQIHQLAIKSALRQRGSKSYQKAWRHWLHLSTNSIRHSLSCILPDPVDEEQLNDLSFSLGVAADVGKMPSFENAGARSGYALDYFCRARLLADLLIDIKSDAHCLGDKCQLTSIGGGPGFDYVAAALVSIFTGAGAEEKTVPINATILDYESGWSNLVNTMNDATRNALPTYNKMSCTWGGRCDLTQSIYHQSNTNCLKVLDTTTLWTCQYCVAENAGKLRQSDYIFFRELFQAAANGATFWITETTPRLWPEFYKLILDYNEQNDRSILRITFPYMRGQQVLIHKDMIRDGSDAEIISKRDAQLILEFERYAQSHEELVDSGWERQRKKTIPLL